MSIGPKRGRQDLAEEQVRAEKYLAWLVQRADGLGLIGDEEMAELGDLLEAGRALETSSRVAERIIVVRHVAADLAVRMWREDLRLREAHGGAADSMWRASNSRPMKKVDLEAGAGRIDDLESENHSHRELVQRADWPACRSHCLAMPGDRPSRRWPRGWRSPWTNGAYRIAAARQRLYRAACAAGRLGVLSHRDRLACRLLSRASRPGAIGLGDDRVPELVSVIHHQASSLERRNRMASDRFTEPNHV